MEQLQWRIEQPRILPRIDGAMDLDRIRIPPRSRVVSLNILIWSSLQWRRILRSTLAITVSLRSSLLRLITPLLGNPPPTIRPRLQANTPLPIE